MRNVKRLLSVAMKPKLTATACLAAAIITGYYLTERSAISAGAPKSSAAHAHRPNIASSWDRKTAAAYLDSREDWWMAWPRAQRDHDTFCVSCHTAVPYALARPALRNALGEQVPSTNERRLLDNVTKRVRLWKEVAPF